MKSKYLLLLGIASILICFSISHVFADENVVFSNDPTNITFESVNFSIPQGFGMKGEVKDYDGMGSEGKTCVYINNDSCMIKLIVITDWMGISLDDFKNENATKDNINGHEGWKYHDKKFEYFGYVENNKGVLVATTNSSKFQEVII